MPVSRIVLPAVLLGLLVLPASGASFDCSKASTPFEHAICDMPELSASDELLAKAFATAIGGLTKESVNLMRADQRNWLDYAQRACTDDAQLLDGTSVYGDTGASCLIEKFTARIGVLEQSRMHDGHRFLIQSIYAALPDPNEADNPDSYWKVASHELVMPLLDADDALAEPFDRFVTDMAANQSDIMSLADGDDSGDIDPSSDTSVRMAVKELAGTSRITLEATTYWYGHGAAHGNWGITYQHYLTEQDRGLIADDLFAGEDWATTLVEAAWAQLQLEHKEWLQVETAGDIAEIVVEPTRWDFSNRYGLTIQFQPYEVAAYAYGAPTITIGWDKLESIMAETQDMVRFGN